MTISAFVPGELPSRHDASRAPRAAPSRSRMRCAKVRRPVPWRAKRTGFKAAANQSPRTDDEAIRRDTALVRRASPRQGVRRFPARRHARGRGARRARRVPLGRAPEALYDARHGDRPGQDLEHQRARHHGRAHRARHSRGRDDDYRGRLIRLSSIGAFAGHHRGKHFRPTRLTAGHDWAQERGATFVEAGQWLRAQWFAAPGENDWLATVSREVKARALERRRLRRVDSGQDRHPGAGRRRVPRPRLHQHVLDAAGRQGALRT